MNQVERKCVQCVYYKYVIGLEDLPDGLGCVAMIAEEISITNDFLFFIFMDSKGCYHSPAVSQLTIPIIHI